MLTDFYSGKNVFVTGHTGFKGAWLSYWLEKLGASITGYSIDIPTQPSFFTALDVGQRLTHITGDIRDLAQLTEALRNSQAQIVFHLAAQSIVLESYTSPIDTFDTNVIGTLKVLEAVRQAPTVKTVVIVTTDKVYENQRPGARFVEDDPLGGTDPYSASKACAEMGVRAYCRSFFSDRLPAIATARAGNVVGGGDWSAHRIVPDAYRAWVNDQALQIRNPESVRPWQHVLEPLAGYLLLARRMDEGSFASGESFNFGPAHEQALSVRALIAKLQSYWPDLQWRDAGAQPSREAAWLELDSTKASEMLGFRAVLDVDTTLEWSALWYESFRNGNRADLQNLTDRQISDYQELIAGGP